MYNRFYHLEQNYLKSVDAKDAGSAKPGILSRDFVSPFAEHLATELFPQIADFKWTGKYEKDFTSRHITYNIKGIDEAHTRRIDVKFIYPRYINDPSLSYFSSNGVACVLDTSDRVKVTDTAKDLITSMIASSLTFHLSKNANRQEVSDAKDEVFSLKYYMNAPDVDTYRPLKHIVKDITFDSRVRAWAEEFVDTLNYSEAFKNDISSSYVWSEMGPTLVRAYFKSTEQHKSLSARVFNEPEEQSQTNLIFQ